jgi:glycosyltransferase involved in cell wall biosynthesis
MKFLLVHNSYKQPGGEDVVFEQERQLLERAGHAVAVYQRSNWEVDSYPGIKRIALLTKMVWAADTRLDFSRLLDKEKPDLVHVHNTFLMVSPAIYGTCRDANVPVVQTLHNYRLFCPAATFFRDGHVCEECVNHGLTRAIAYGCYRNSRTATSSVALMLSVHRQLGTWVRNINCYIALTQFARNRFLNAGLPAEKVFVKPNFVDPDPGVCSPSEGSYALFVGRLSPEKRVNTVLRAWRHLGRLGIPLVIIGGGPERLELQQESINYGLTDVVFRGQVSRQESLAAIGGARFLVFSSEWYENFPVTIAESFACGVPVICSRMGAMQEIVKHGQTGLHFTAGDSKDLAETVKWAWDHPERMRSMGLEARREFETKYTAERNYPLLMEIYQHALSANRQIGEMSQIV